MNRIFVDKRIHEQVEYLQAIKKRFYTDKSISEDAYKMYRQSADDQLNYFLELKQMMKEHRMETIAYCPLCKDYVLEHEINQGSNYCIVCHRIENFKSIF